MKKDPMAMANALGLTAAIVYVACRIFVQLLPELSVSITKSWFHVFDMTRGSLNLSSDTFFLGLVSSAVSAWLIGYLFAVIYNMFARGKR